MKVALVLTGLMRRWDLAYPWIKHCILDRYDTDVFIATWSEAGMYSGKGYLHGPQDHFIKTASDDKGYHDSGELIDASWILNTYKPKSFYIRDFASTFERVADVKAKRFVNAFTRPKNTITQAYLISEGMSLIWDTGGKYDLIVRARPDIVLEHDLEELTPNEFLTLPSKNKMGRGTGDSLQIGSVYHVTTYAQMYFHLNELYDKLGYSCPHEFAELWIKENKLPWRELQAGAHIAHSQSGTPYEEPK
jgi:hypothetical protein